MDYWVFYMVGCTIIIILWEKGKSGGSFVILNMAFILANLIAMYKDYNGFYNNDLSLINYVGDVGLYLIEFIFIFALLYAFINFEKEEGVKKLQKDKDEYENLIEKESLNANETKRLKYLTKMKNKNDFQYKEYF